jgi:iron(III) transport system permease protein
VATGVGRTLIGNWRRAERPVIVAGALLILALAIVPPLAHVLRGLVQASDAFRLLVSGRLWELFVRSLLLSASVTVASVVVGVPLGVLFARARVPFRGLLVAAHLSVAFLPPFLPALGWFHIFGRQGLLGGELSAQALFSEMGAIGVMTSCFAPVVSALTALGIAGVDGSLEEAARLSMSRFRTAALVLVPCAAPAISLAALVVFALSFSELGVPMFLGVDVYPTVIFARLGGMDFAPGEAAVFMLPLILVALVLAGVERRFAGHRAVAAIGGARPSERALFPFRASSCLILIVAAAVSVAPIAALLISAELDGTFAEILGWIGNTPFISLMSSAAAAALMTFVAVVLGWEVTRRSAAGASADGLSTLAFMMPSSILGVGLIVAWNRQGTVWLYGSFVILVVGFVARYCAIAIRTYAAVLTQVPASLDEAARVTGATYIHRLGLTLRMTPRGIAGTFLLALSFALRDLETAVLYYPAGGQPLTVRIFTLEANGPPGVVAALAVLHVALTLAALGLGAVLLRRQSG